MNAQGQNRDYGFMIGLLTGTFVGAGIAMWLAPNSTAEARGRVAAAGRRIGGELREATDELRDQAADAVTRGAHELKRVAAAAKSDRV